MEVYSLVFDELFTSLLFIEGYEHAVLYCFDRESVSEMTS